MIERAVVGAVNITGDPIIAWSNLITIDAAASTEAKTDEQGQEQANRSHDTTVLYGPPFAGAGRAASIIFTMSSIDQRGSVRPAAIALLAVVYGSKRKHI
jgi:hypothetical protein